MNDMCFRGEFYWCDADKGIDTFTVFTVVFSSPRLWTKVKLGVTLLWYKLLTAFGVSFIVLTDLEPFSLTLVYFLLGERCVTSQRRLRRRLMFSVPVVRIKVLKTRKSTKEIFYNSWMLLFSYLWLIIFDLLLLHTCFPLDVGGCGRLHRSLNQ